MHHHNVAGNDGGQQPVLAQVVAREAQGAGNVLGGVDSQCHYYLNYYSLVAVVVFAVEILSVVSAVGSLDRDWWIVIVIVIVVVVVVVIRQLLLPL